jgi:hypothetical protein
VRFNHSVAKERIKKTGKKTGFCLKNREICYSLFGAKDCLLLLKGLALVASADER